MSLAIRQVYPRRNAARNIPPGVPPFPPSFRAGVPLDDFTTPMDLRSFQHHVRGQDPSAIPQLLSGYYDDLSAFDVAMQDRAAYLPLLADTLQVMPPGYRTALPRHWFDGITLGVLVHYLHGRLGNLNGLYISGQFVNFSQRVIVEPDPSRGINELTGQPFRSYNKTNQTGDISINRVPLSRIVPIQSSAGPPQMQDGLEDLLDSIREDPGGSNFDCLVGFQEVWIERLHAHRVGPVPAKVLPIRTAGFGQLITRPFRKVFQSNQQSYTLFIPDGRNNCVEQCLEQAYVIHEQILHAEECFDQCGQPDPVTINIPRPPFDVANCIGEFQGNWKYIIQQRALSQKGKSVAVYWKKYINGFTDKELRAIARLLYASPLAIRLFVWTEKKNGNDSFRWCDSMKIPHTRTDASVLDINLFIMVLDGKLWSSRDPIIHSLFEEEDEEARDDSEIFINFTHSILLYSTSPLSSSKAVLKNIIQSFTVPFVKSLVQDVKFNPRLTSTDFERMVEFQLIRHQKKQTRTSMFSPIDYSKFQATQSYKRKRVDPNAKPSIYVYTWDCETVENRPSPTAYPTYPAFDKCLPGTITSPLPILPSESQIPWSCQWVAVNASDPVPSTFASEKRKNHFPIIQYESQHPDPNCQDFLLGEVQTEYGNYQLGKCIEDMLVNIARDCWERSGCPEVDRTCKAYIWSHNGHHFDHYILLQFCRFQHEQNPLKTNRGLLSLYIRVPVMQYEQYSLLNETERANIPHVLIICMDTYLHFAQKLSSLGKSFKVPQEFQKLDFPITRVNNRNCYHSEVLDITKPYGENDVISLAYIVHKMNIVYANSKWEPASPFSPRPPVCQFVTAMSIVKKATYKHFKKTSHQMNSFPQAIDIPALRNMVNAAMIGGRVTAYAKTYSSPLTSLILTAFLNKDIEDLKTAHQMLINENLYMMVLDVTSLYPYVQSHYPMPTGALRFATKEDCETCLTQFHCDDCILKLHDCGKEHTLPSFHVIFVEYVTPPPNRSEMRNLFPRKIFNTDSQKVLDLLYSLESELELFERLPYANACRSMQSFSHVDLYWMKRAGWTFKIVCGLSWDSTRIYDSMLTPAFMERIEAKKAGNDILSEFLKLLYNGTYGVTAEREIKESHYVVDLPPEIWKLKLSPLSSELQPIIRDFLKKHQNNYNPLVDCELKEDAVYLPSNQLLIKLKKRIESAQTFADLSPNQIGIAVVAYARHVMNLIMMNLNPPDISYTDTDSVCVAAHCLPRMSHFINNSADAALGTLKNDHLKLKDGRKNGNNPVVFLSLIGTKKVKMHFTLNELGEVHIFNTFKGFQPSPVQPDGSRSTQEQIQQTIAKAIFSISMFGYNGPELVQHWRRDLVNGITIEKPSPQNFDSKTYLGHCKGTKTWIRPHGTMEMFIPFGCSVVPDYPVEKIPTPDQVQLDPKRLDDYPTILHCDPFLILRTINQYYSPPLPTPGPPSPDELEQQCFIAIFDALDQAEY